MKKLIFNTIRDFNNLLIDNPNTINNIILYPSNYIDYYKILSRYIDSKLYCIKIKRLK